MHLSPVGNLLLISRRRVLAGPTLCVKHGDRTRPCLCFLLSFPFVPDATFSRTLSSEIDMRHVTSRTRVERSAIDFAFAAMCNDTQKQPKDQLLLTPLRRGARRSMGTAVHETATASSRLSSHAACLQGSEG